MLPVENKNVFVIDLDKKNLSKNEKKYYKLLKEQIFWLNRNNSSLYNRAKNLYDKYMNDTLPQNIKQRCCNFKLLEEKCLEYNKVNIKV